MAIFPRIQSPCPIKGDLKAFIDGDVCRLCKREVTDIGEMSDAQRLAFLASCQDEVCVSYKLPLKPAVAAAAAVAAMAVPLAAAAQDIPTPAASEIVLDCPEETWIVMGGIKDLKKLVLFDAESDRDLPEISVIYEDDEPAAAPKPTPKGEA